MEDKFFGPFTLISLLVIIIAVGVYRYVYRHEIATTEQVRQLSRRHMDDAESGSEVAPDDWGRPMRFHRIASESAVSQTITSSGADGKFGTDDDISHTDTDLNKSRIVGKWVGSRTKELVKGLKDGEKESTRFEKFEPKKEPTSKPSLWERIKGK